MAFTPFGYTLMNEIMSIVLSQQVLGSSNGSRTQVKNTKANQKNNLNERAVGKIPSNSTPK
jgi:hypothetical protein